MHRLFAVTPTPVATPPAYTGNPDLVTPTWVGFAITFLVALIVVFLVVDMVRRIRRVSYRGQIGAQLDAEQAESDAAVLREREELEAEAARTGKPLPPAEKPEDRPAS